MGDRKLNQFIGKLLKRDADAEQITYSVLVVSDDPGYLPQLCDIIQSEGHEATCGTGAREALELLEEMAVPDLMIFDLVDPEHDAREILDKARIRFGKSTTPPVLFLRDTPEDEAAAHELYADDVLLKPVTSEELLDRVNKLGRKLQENADKSA